MRQSDDRPAGGAAAAATDGAAIVDGALGLLEEGLEQLASVDAAQLSERGVADAVRRLGKLDGRIDGIQARFVAAAERAGLPERSGAGSTTTWVSQQTGRSGGQAARTGRLARTSESAPEVADAVADGRIGPDQANTIASGLDRDELEPEDVPGLLKSAGRLSPRMFQKEARRVAGERRQERLRNQELVARDERHYRQWRTENGSLRFEGLVPPAEGDLVEKAMSAFYEPDGTDVPDDQRRTHDQRSADAFTSMVEAGLRAGAAGEVGGVLPSISVLVPFEAMAPLADATGAGITAETDRGTILSIAAYKKLACDATLRRVVIDAEGRPLDVGRATRKWSPAQRAAIIAIDGGCRAPNCDLPPDRCIIHHIRWWQDGGTTSVDNGAMLCRHGHDLVHDDGWTMEMDPATRIITWTSPDGTEIVTHPRGAAARGTRASDDATGPRDGQSDPSDATDPSDPTDPNDSTGPSDTRGSPARGDPARSSGDPPDAGGGPPATAALPLDL